MEERKVRQKKGEEGVKEDEEVEGEEGVEGEKGVEEVGDDAVKQLRGQKLSPSSNCGTTCGSPEREREKIE